jgi:hypothetical protein
MGIAFGETGVFCRIKPGIHAGKDREVAARRQRQVALVPEILCVSRVGSQHFIQDLGHILRLLLRCFLGGQDIRKLSALPSRF